MAKLFDQQQLSAGVQEFEEHLRRVRDDDWTVDCQLAKPRNDPPPPPRREGGRKAIARNAKGAAPATRKGATGRIVDGDTSSAALDSRARGACAGHICRRHVARAYGWSRANRRRGSQRDRVRCSFRRPVDQPSHAVQDAPRCFRAQRDVCGDDPARWFADPGHDAARDRHDVPGLPFPLPTRSAPLSRAASNRSRRLPRRPRRTRLAKIPRPRNRRRNGPPRAPPISPASIQPPPMATQPRPPPVPPTPATPRWRRSPSRPSPPPPSPSRAKPRAASVAAAKETDGASQRTPDADDGGIFEGAKQAVGSLTGAVKKLVGAD